MRVALAQITRSSAHPWSEVCMSSPSSLDLSIPDDEWCERIEPRSRLVFGVGEGKESGAIEDQFNT